MFPMEKVQFANRLSGSLHHCACGYMATIRNAHKTFTRLRDMYDT